MSLRVTHWRNRETGEVRCDRYACLPFSERHEDLGIRRRWRGLVLGWHTKALTCAVCGRTAYADESEAS